VCAKRISRGLGVGWVLNSSAQNLKIIYDMKTIWKGIKFLGKAYVNSYSAYYSDLIKKGIYPPINV
jgi:hypothetical protein